jgi:Tfp pilus assembly protein PilF
MYAAQNDADRAIRELEALLETSPDLVIAYKTLGTLYQGQERYDEAIAAYQRYLESNPDDISTQIQLGLAYQNAEQPEEALSIYHQVLENSPDSALTKNQVAWLYADLGKELDTALQLAQEAEAARPVSGIIDTVGWVHYKREEYDLAVAKFQQALNITPLQAEIRYHLALAYTKQGNSAKALEELRYALQIDPNFAQAEAAQKLVEELQGEGN